MLMQADPPEQVVLDAANYAKQQNVDVIIGFGGGSPLDVAKVIALLAHPKQIQSLQEMYGVKPSHYSPPSTYFDSYYSWYRF